MSRIQFGTDGWRAVMAEDFTFANVERVTQAAADYWATHPQRRTEKRVIVGYDRRFLSDQFAQCAAAIFAGNDFRVVLATEPTPTPSVSFEVKRLKAVGGVMFTASHNPAIFNGYKLKAHFGGPADPDLCQAVEALIDTKPIRSIPYHAALQGQRVRLRNLTVPHFAAIKDFVDYKRIAKSGLRVAHEAMYGVGAGCFEALLAGTTCEVTTLNGNHDPLFGGISPEPVSVNYVKSAAWLNRHPHDICLVTDGDADRLGGMDGHGHSLSTHQIICLLLDHLLRRRKGKGRMVKALTTTSMLDKMCAEHGLELTETGVGFKYICAEMLKGDVLLGAEESGGIGFGGQIPERDGIMAGMMLLEMLATEKKPIQTLLARLEKKYGPHAYERLDTRFPVEERAMLMEFCQQQPPARLLSSPVTDIKTFDGIKYIAANGSWLMLRGSGTEPILRIYAEAATPAEAQQLIQLGVKLTESAQGKR